MYCIYCPGTSMDRTQCKSNNAFCGGCGSFIEKPVNFFPFRLNPRFVEFAIGWHNGQTSALYSVSSTGTIHSVDIIPLLYVELRMIFQDHSKGKNMIEPNDLETMNLFIELAERFEFLFCRE